MYIQNATYKTVPTAGLTFPLAEGTVLTVGDVTGIVPENISLAAPTGLIYLAVGGTIDLTSEANAGITFTDAELNALGGDFNFIPLAESGGSSLPSFTSADKGKVLTIGDGEESVTTVIVPEQTMAVSDSPSPVVGADSSAFVVGTTAVLSAHGERNAGGEYTLTCVEQEGIMGFAGEGAPLVFFLYEGSVLVRGSSDTWTFSLAVSVPSVEPKWEAAGGGIEFFPVNATATTHTAGITAGEMQEILLAGKVPVGIAVYSGEPVNTYIIGGVAAGKAGSNDIVIGSLTSVTVNELTDYPVLWRS